MKQPDTPGQQPAGESGFVVKCINFFLFQSVWLITVFGASRGLTWPGITAMVIFASIHGWAVAAPKKDFVLLAVAVLAGFGFDSVLIRTGLLQVTTTFPMPGLAPLWMVILWANLALAINYCLGWLHGRYWLAAVFGAIGGPLAYLGGTALGAGTFTAGPTSTIGLLATAWFFITPLLFRMAALLENRLGKASPGS